VSVSVGAGVGGAPGSGVGGGPLIADMSTGMGKQAQVLKQASILYGTGLVTEGVSEDRTA
jgi:hypothetical protein